LAIKAMETLTEKDMSKGNLFSDNANSHLRRLTQFKDDKLAEMDTGSK
jgi:ribosomal protein L14E/L6E/L27E